MTSCHQLGNLTTRSLNQLLEWHAPYHTAERITSRGYQKLSGQSARLVYGSSFVRVLSGTLEFFFPIAPCLAWDKLAEVVSLLAEFHACHNFISITSYTLISRFNSLDLIDICIDKRFEQFQLSLCYFQCTDFNWISKEFSPNHSTSLKHTYFSLLVIGPMVLEQRQCSPLSLI